jgi:hypothetical protein
MKLSTPPRQIWAQLPSHPDWPPEKSESRTEASANHLREIPAPGPYVKQSRTDEASMRASEWFQAAMAPPRTAAHEEKAAWWVCRVDPKRAEAPPPSCAEHPTTAVPARSVMEELKSAATPPPLALSEVELRIAPNERRRGRGEERKGR